MNRNKCIIKFGLYHPTLCPLAKKCFQDWESLLWKSKLQAKQYGKQTPDDCPYHPCYQELFPDGFMILAENIFCDKRFLMMMDMVFIMMHIVVSYHVSVSMQWCFVTHNLFFVRQAD